MPKNPKFTRIPKVKDLAHAGVPTEAIPTYCALSDYANNKTGLAWPKMQTLAKTLNRSVRTVQRHLHLLREIGLIQFVERRRNRGRYSSYLFKVLHSATTGHGRPLASINKRRTRPRLSKKAPSNQEYDQTEHRKRQEARRKEAYEWLFSRPSS